MGIRETLNKNPVLATSIVVVLMILSIVWLVKVMKPEPMPETSSKAFYSNDDGKTYFTDDVNKVVPFTRDGKEAVLAAVFKCPGEEAFVGYLVRLKAKTKANIEKESDPKLQAQMVEDALNSEDHATLEVKQPGTAGWFPGDSSNIYMRITSVKCKNSQEFAPRIQPGQE